MFSLFCCPLLLLQAGPQGQRASGASSKVHHTQALLQQIAVVAELRGDGLVNHFQECWRSQGY